MLVYPPPSITGKVSMVFSETKKQDWAFGLICFQSHRGEFGHDIRPVQVISESPVA